MVDPRLVGRLVGAMRGETISALIEFSPSLEKVCMRIIDFRDYQLKTSHDNMGNILTKFVEKDPEKTAYFKVE